MGRILTQLFFFFFARLQQDPPVLSTNQLEKEKKKKKERKREEEKGRRLSELSGANRFIKIKKTPPQLLLTRTTKIINEQNIFMHDDRWDFPARKIIPDQA